MFEGIPKMLLEELFTSTIGLNRLITEAININEKLNLAVNTYSSPVKFDLEEFWTAVEYDLSDLIAMPPKSLGRALGIYLLLMTKDQAAIHGVPAPKRFPIKHPIDPKLYTRDRMRQTHDIVHMLTNFNTSQEGEIGLQAFYLAQRNSPLSPLQIMQTIGNFWARKVGKDYLSAITEGLEMGVQAKPYIALQIIEERFTHDIEEIRTDMNIVPGQGKTWNWS
jgi:ubiquinone biosynthesis protein COQ4